MHTLLFLTFLVIVIALSAAKIYGKRLNNPKRNVKPHNQMWSVKSKFSYAEREDWKEFNN